MRSISLTLVSILLVGFSKLLAQTTDVFSTPGTYSWVVPPCVTSITVEVWGGGGGGGAVWSRFNPTDNSSPDAEACTSAGGGGGGGYSRRVYAVTPGQVYNIVVGNGGQGGIVDVSLASNRAQNGSPGGNSTFSGPATVGPGTLTGFGGSGGFAANFLRNNCNGGCWINHEGVNGNGGAGGAGANGTTMFSGGNGAAGAHSGSTNDRSGGGGGGAGTMSNGGNATSVTTGGTGGNASGGNGANGIVQPYGSGYLGTNGNIGNTLGGGGGGACGHNRLASSSTHRSNIGGNGARGEVRITYTAPVPTDPTFIQVAPICSGDPLSPLPTTSTNGVTGTWSPAIDNTTTTLYTFTPTAGLCANTATMTIVVNSIPTISAQPPNTPICATGSATVSATASGGVYQWQYFDGSTWNNVVNGTPAGYTYSNATTTSLGITTSNAPNSAPCLDAQFRLLVGSVPCQIISSTANVTVVRATRIAPTGPQCSGTQLNFDACPSGASYSWSVTPPVGTSATPTLGGSQTFSFTPTNTTGVSQIFTVNSSVTYLGLTCPQTFSPTINAAPNAGTNNNTSVCETGSSINLFASLGGSPAATGTWSGGLTGGNLGTYDPLTLAPGTYTYTVTAAGCADATATVTVTETAGPNAGSNGPASVCETGSPINLFASLSGSPAATGTWSGGLTGGNLGTYDPTTFTPGNYTYTVTAAGCANATATVAVSETAGPNAGSNGPASICETGSPINLFTSLGGSPAATGTWSGGLTGGNLGTYDPATFAPGNFTYTVSLAGCADATATVTVTEAPAPNAGSNGPASVCETGSPINLFSSLGGSPAATGTWSGGLTGGNLGTYDPLTFTPGNYTYTVTAAGCADATATVTVAETTGPNAGSNGPASVCETGTPINLFSSLGGSPAATGTWSGGLTGGNLGTYDPLTFTPGNYTYTVTAAGCADATATVTVAETTGPNAGSNGPASVCETGTPINLFGSLGGTPAATGTWSGGLTGGNLGTYDPATFAPGNFTYTVSLAGCADATATVTVTEAPAPNAGSNGPASVCATGSPINLFTSLGGSPAATGTWSGGLTGGNLGTYDPTTFTPGTFTYTVTAAGCADATATVTVTETAGPNAGTNGPASVCATGSPINLFASLGGTPAATGTWSGGLTGGNLGTYDPTTFTPGTFTYTVTAAGCADATATVTVSETAGPNAGSNGPASVCETGTPIDLFASLGGSPAATGTWSGGLTGGNLGTYDPATFTPGNFTYTVSLAGCADATATVTVTESAAPNAGSNGPASVCETGSPIDLFASLGGTPAATGTWSGGLTGGNLGTYDPLTFTPGTYTYTVTAAGCADATATVTVAETAGPNAGANNTANICQTGTPINLFASLGGTPAATGTWSGGLTGGNLGTYDPTTFAPGTFTYTVSSVGCADATATVTVTESPAPDAGTNNNASVCETGSSINLFASLGGTPAATGTWSGGLTGGNLGTYDPATFAPGTYTYTVTAAGCANATATVTVAETAGPNAGTNNTANICQTGTPINLFASLGGTPVATGTWSGGLTGGNLGTYDPATFAPGTFTYTVSSVGCADATATVTVTESPAPNAGTDNNVNVCETGSSINLFASLGGTPAATGTWSGGLTGGNLGTYDPATLSPGSFTYTVSAAGCADAIANIIVTEAPAPDAGTISGSAALCEAGTAILASDGDASGIWTSSNTSVVTVDASGNVAALIAGTAIISYTVTAIAPCTVDAIATFNIAISSPPNAGTDGDLLICSDVTVSASSLFAELGGTPDAGGTWSPQPSGSGVYTYTITAVAPCPNPSSAIVTVTEENCEIIIPTGFTPGGDGENDTWEIIGLDNKYPSNLVIIYNRWGNEIYRSKEGQYSLDPWDGTFNGETMPVSSYYYMILPNGENTEKEDIMNGTITIIKE